MTVTSPSCSIRSSRSAPNRSSRARVPMRNRPDGSVPPSLVRLCTPGSTTRGPSTRDPSGAKITRCSCAATSSEPSVAGTAAPTMPSNACLADSASTPSVSLPSRTNPAWMSTQMILLAATSHTGPSASRYDSTEQGTAPYRFMGIPEVIWLEPKVGLEPTTVGLRNRCSTTELLRPARGAILAQSPPGRNRTELLRRHPAVDELVVIARRRVGIGDVLRDRRHRRLALRGQHVVGADIGQGTQAADRPRRAAGVPPVPDGLDVERI